MTRAFIIGNGPSLAKLDLTKLKGEITFGCNTIYDLYDKMGFRTTYYFNIDSLIALLTRKEALEYISHDDVKTGYFHPAHCKYFQYPKCECLKSEEVMGCCTVGMVMIWKAIKLGYKPIYIIGFDLNYKYPPRNNLIQCKKPDDIICDKDTKAILEDAKGLINWNNVYYIPEDKSHATDIYAKKKIPIHWDTTENILKAYERNFNNLSTDVKDFIYNAGIGGNLNFVKRVNYNDLFS